MVHLEKMPAALASKAIDSLMKAITRFEPALDFLPRSFEMARLLRHPKYWDGVIKWSEKLADSSMDTWAAAGRAERPTDA